jgi:endonuclease/exonuclease/phosphatase (EEP) superfamily protein YafD
LVYAAGLLIWFVAKAFTGDESLFVLSFSYLGVWLFFPLLVFGPWVFLNWSKPGLLLLAIPVGFFLWFYGPLLMPRRTQTVGLTEPVSVLTFNLMYTNTDVEALLDVLDSRQAEILALQEVNEFHEEHLSAALVERYPYHWYYEPAGLAIYSAHPLLAQEIYPAQPWAIQSAVIQVNETPIHLINAHLAKPGILLVLETRDVGVVQDLAAARLGQIAQIKNAIHENGLSTIVGCDCNMTNLTSAYAQLTADLQDAFKERGWGLGHTFLLPRGFELRTRINLPVQRIDYIFHSPEIRSAEVRVVSGDSGSDHRPVWARFDLRAQDGEAAAEQSGLAVR